MAQLTESIEQDRASFVSWLASVQSTLPDAKKAWTWLHTEQGQQALAEVLLEGTDDLVGRLGQYKGNQVEIKRQVGDHLIVQQTKTGASTRIALDSDYFTLIPEGPFTGKGFAELELWQQGARAAEPVEVDAARAREIVEQAREATEHGPWSDNVERVLQPGEYRYVYDFWDTLPGDTSFVDALYAVGDISPGEAPLSGEATTPLARYVLSKLLLDSKIVQAAQVNPFDSFLVVADDEVDNAVIDVVSEGPQHLHAAAESYFEAGHEDRRRAIAKALYDEAQSAPAADGKVSRFLEGLMEDIGYDPDGVDRLDIAQLGALFDGAKEYTEYTERTGEEPVTYADLLYLYKKLADDLKRAAPGRAADIDRSYERAEDLATSLRKDTLDELVKDLTSWAWDELERAEEAERRGGEEQAAEILDDAMDQLHKGSITSGKGGSPAEWQWLDAGPDPEAIAEARRRVWEAVGTQYRMICGRVGCEALPPPPPGPGQMGMFGVPDVPLEPGEPVPPPEPAQPPRPATPILLSQYGIVPDEATLKQAIPLAYRGVRAILSSMLPRAQDVDAALSTFPKMLIAGWLAERGMTAKQALFLANKWAMTGPLTKDKEGLPRVPSLPIPEVPDKRWSPKKADKWLRKNTHDMLPPHASPFQASVDKRYNYWIARITREGTDPETWVKVQESTRKGALTHAMKHSVLWGRLWKEYLLRQLGISDDAMALRKLMSPAAEPDDGPALVPEPGQTAADRAATFLRSKLQPLFEDYYLEVYKRSILGGQSVNVQFFRLRGGEKAPGGIKENAPNYRIYISASDKRGSEWKKDADPVGKLTAQAVVHDTWDAPDFRKYTSRRTGLEGLEQVLQHVVKWFEDNRGVLIGETPEPPPEPKTADPEPPPPPEPPAAEPSTEERPPLPKLVPVTVQLSSYGKSTSKKVPRGEYGYKLSNEVLLEQGLVQAGWQIITITSRGSYIHAVPPGKRKLGRGQLVLKSEAPTEAAFTRWADAVHAYYTKYPDKLRGQKEVRVMIDEVPLLWRYKAETVHRFKVTKARIGMGKGGMGLHQTEEPTYDETRMPASLTLYIPGGNLERRWRDALDPVTTVKAIVYGQPSPPKPRTEPSGSSDRESSWESPVYGKVRVVEGAKGRRATWHNIHATVSGKKMRYGWNGKRWARKQTPPDRLKQEVIDHGWGPLFGWEAGPPPPEPGGGEEAEDPHLTPEQLVTPTFKMKKKYGPTEYSTKKLPHRLRGLGPDTQREGDFPKRKWVVDFQRDDGTWVEDKVREPLYLMHEQDWREAARRYNVLDLIEEREPASLTLDWHGGDTAVIFTPEGGLGFQVARAWAKAANSNVYMVRVLFASEAVPEGPDNRHYLTRDGGLKTLPSVGAWPTGDSSVHFTTKDAAKAAAGDFAATKKQLPMPEPPAIPVGTSWQRGDVEYSVSQWYPQANAEAKDFPPHLRRPEGVYGVDAGQQRLVVWTLTELWDQLQGADAITKRAEGREAAEQARKAAEAAEIAAEEDTDGFADQFSPMKRGRIIKILNKQIGLSGVFKTRKQHARDLVAEGWRVKERRGQRVLEGPDGSFYDDDNVTTKTMLDYVQWLTDRASEEQGSLPHGFDSFKGTGTATTAAPAFEKANEKLVRGVSFKMKDRGGPGSTKRTYTITDQPHQGLRIAVPRSPDRIGIRRIANVKPGLRHGGQLHRAVAIVVSPVELKGHAHRVGINAYLPDNAAYDVSPSSYWVGTFGIVPLEQVPSQGKVSTKVGSAEYTGQLSKAIKKYKKRLGIKSIRQNYKGTGRNKHRRQLYLRFKNGAVMDIWLESSGVTFGGVVMRGGRGRKPSSVPYNDRSAKEVSADVRREIHSWLHGDEAQVPLSLKVPDNVYDEWTMLEVDTLHEHSSKGKQAFVAAMEDAEERNRRWIIPLTPEALRYLYSSSGPINNTLDVLSDRVEYEQGDEKRDTKKLIKALRAINLPALPATENLHTARPLPAARAAAASFTESLPVRSSGDIARDVITWVRGKAGEGEPYSQIAADIAQLEAEGRPASDSRWFRILLEIIKEDRVGYRSTADNQSAAHQLSPSFQYKGRGKLEPAAYDDSVVHAWVFEDDTRVRVGVVYEVADHTFEVAYAIGPSFIPQEVAAGFGDEEDALRAAGRWMDHLEDVHGDSPDTPLYKLATEAKHRFEEGGELPRTAPVIHSAGLAIVRPGEILVVHPTGGSWRKGFSIPKGHVEESESAMQAAIRETFEEAGLDMEAEGFKGPYEVYKADGSKKVTYWVVDASRLDLPDEVSEDNLRSPHEVDWAGFIPVQDARKQLSGYQLPVLDHVPAAVVAPGEDAGEYKPSLTSARFQRIHADALAPPGATKWVTQLITDFATNSQWSRHLAEHGFGGMELDEVQWRKRASTLNAIWRHRSSPIAVGVVVRPVKKRLRYAAYAEGLPGGATSKARQRPKAPRKSVPSPTAIFPDRWLDYLEAEYGGTSGTSPTPRMRAAVGTGSVDLLTKTQQGYLSDLIERVQGRKPPLVGFKLLNVRVEPPPHSRGFVALMNPQTEQQLVFVLPPQGSPYPFASMVPPVDPRPGEIVIDASTLVTDQVAALRVPQSSIESALKPQLPPGYRVGATRKYTVVYDQHGNMVARGRTEHKARRGAQKRLKGRLAEMLLDAEQSGRGHAHDDRGRPVDVGISFGPNLTREQLGTLFEVEQLLRRLGVTFDTGFAFGSGTRDWEWDWSLEGPVEVTFRKFSEAEDRVGQQRGVQRAIERLPAGAVACVAGGDRIRVSGDGDDVVSTSAYLRRAQWPRLERAAKSILAKHGYPLGDKHLGCGTYGCVYDLTNDPDKVVKLTTDWSEAAAAQVVLDHEDWTELPALARIDCVYALTPMPDGEPLWAIVQQKLKPLDWRAEDFLGSSAAGSLAAILLTRGWDRQDPELDEALENLDGWARAMLDSDQLQQYKRVISTIEALHNEVGVQWGDLHGGNVMQDAEGNWKIIDLGVSKSAGADVGRLEALPLRVWTTCEQGHREKLNEVQVNAGNRVRCKRASGCYQCKRVGKLEGL